jgi:membrane-associated phospholipid phosphatase
VGARARFTSNERVQPGSRSAVPLLDAHERGPARRVAHRLRGSHPAAVFFAAILAGVAALCLIAVALGLLVTDVLLHASGVPRERPPVKRLDDLPANDSFPSGHTAASVAVYVGLALLITSRFRHRGVRLLAWAVAILVPVLVAFARMYRGMHHPLDVAGGCLIGLGAVLVLLFACRAASVAHQARGPARVSIRHPMRKGSPWLRT